MRDRGEGNGGIIKIRQYPANGNAVWGENCKYAHGGAGTIFFHLVVSFMYSTGDGYNCGHDKTGASMEMVEGVC